MPACLQVKGTKDPIQSRIKPIKDLKESFFAPTICLQCGDPACVSSCPAKALTKNRETGVIEWNKECCVNCLLCTLACPYGGVFFDPVEGHVAKCDQIGGDPACVKVCKPKALVHRQESEIFNRAGDLEDLFVANSCCQGCNTEIHIRHVLRRVGPNTVLAMPPGCVPGTGSVGVNGRTTTKVPVFHPLLTNTASMLAGIKRYYNRIGRDVTMLALAGDGGTADVGFQSLSGAAERGEQMVFVCIYNEGYMNTGTQRSGTTPFGAWTSTTPVGDRLRGKTSDQKYMPLIMVMHRCEYVATASVAYLDDFYKELDHAIESSKKGLAYLHVFSPCTSGWRFDGSMTIEDTALKAQRDNLRGRLITLATLHNVKLELCDITRSRLGLDKGKLYTPVTLVPSGVVRIAQVQNQEGFAYMKWSRLGKRSDEVAEHRARDQVLPFAVSDRTLDLSLRR